MQQIGSLRTGWHAKGWSQGPAQLCWLLIWLFSVCDGQGRETTQGKSQSCLPKFCSCGASSAKGNSLTVAIRVLLAVSWRGKGEAVEDDPEIARLGNGEHDCGQQQRWKVE